MKTCPAYLSKLSYGICLLSFSLFFCGCQSSPSPAATADLIFLNGDVVTVSDSQPSAQAVAVKEGKILMAGSNDEITKMHKGPTTQIVDLAGKTLIPGFVDPHSHFISALSITDWANVSAPPVGTVNSIADIVAELKKHAETQHLAKGQPIIGYGYDGNMLSDKRDITRDDLDPAFPDNPVMLIHVSLHGAVLNSAAMKMFHITAATKTPPGGVIIRKPGSQEPAGLLMETAYIDLVATKLPPPNQADVLKKFKAAQDLYASNGYTTANEGASQLKDIDLLKTAASQNLLFLDLEALPVIIDLKDTLAKYPASTWGTFDHHLKLAAVKALIDGSPQGKTAYFTTPYLTGGPEGEKRWLGEPTFPQKTFEQMMQTVYDNNLRIFNHCNGDAAIDLFLNVHEKLSTGKISQRPVIIHSQFVRKDQLERYLKLGIMPSFYTEHTFYFGDIHIKNRGMQQASFISPMNTAYKMGLHASNHTDFSVLPLDPFFVIWTAMNRTTRSGVVLGPEERITALQALKAMTIEGAYEYMEEGSKGSIEPGKLADLVVLTANPLKAEGDQIKDIKVLETFKEGKSVWKQGL